MSETTVPAAEPSTAVTSPLPRVERAEAAPWALALALGVAVLYAAFASGAIDLPEESKLQIGIGVISVGTVAALLFGRGLRLSTPTLGVAGFGLLAAFAVWIALSFTWSIAPDETWVEFNRAVSYTLVAGLALVLGSSLPRPVERIAIGYLAIATVVSLYALGGKVLPGVHVEGLFDFNNTEFFSRLRAPIEYWNALAIFCVLAVPIGLRMAADTSRDVRLRLAALATLVPLLATLILTYSRGGLVALIVGLAVLLVLSADRVRLLAFAAVGAVAAAPAVLVALVREDLTNDGVQLAAREGDGLVMLAALVLGVAACVAIGRLLTRADDRLTLSAEGQRSADRVLVGVGALAVLASIVVLASSLDSFTAVQRDRQNDPARVLQTNSGNRWVWWKEAAGAWSDRPLIGHGAGSFPLLHKAYRENLLEVKQPHSVPLEFLSETGLIGAGLGLGGLVLLGIAGTRRWGGSTAGPDRLYTAALIAAGSAWGLHLLVDWDWDIPAVMMPGLIFLGVLAARPGAPSPPGGESGPRAVGLALATVAAAAVVASALLPALAHDHVDDALALVNKGGRENLKKADKEASLARRLNPFSVEPLFAESTIAEERNRPSEAIEALAEAAERQPDNPAVWTRLARYQLFADDSPGAFRSIANLRKLDPGSRLAGLLLLQALYDEGRSATATGTPLPRVTTVPPGQTPASPPGGVAPPGGASGGASGGTGAGGTGSTGSGGTGSTGGGTGQGAAPPGQ